jgi:hypothetical protein
MNMKSKGDISPDVTINLDDPELFITILETISNDRSLL